MRWLELESVSNNLWLEHTKLPLAIGAAIFELRLESRRSKSKGRDQRQRTDLKKKRKKK